jgi:TonB family protein
MTAWPLIAFFLAAPATTAAAEPEPELTRLPELTKFVEAVYPERARSEGVEAVVVLDLDLDATGHVEAATVVTPAALAGYGFEEAALAAVRQFVFSPAEAGGQPVPVRITYRYGFALQQVLAPRPPVVSLEGHLLERGTRAKLPGLRVTVFQDGGQAFEALSDASGLFQFFDLAPGDWKVAVEGQGYYPFRTTESVAKDELLEVTYHVERLSYDPNDVLVEASRPRKELTRRTLDTQEIDKVPGTFGDAVSVVTNLPSVARPPLGLGLLIVRGSSPEDTRVALGGIDVPSVYHFGALRSVVPTSVIESVDFFPGNFSPYYGRAIGGYLDVRLKRLAPEQTHGYLDLSLMDTSAYVETPVGDDAAIAVGLRRSYLDFIMNATIPSDSTVTFSTAPRYYDMQVLGSWTPSRTQHVQAFFFGSDDSMRLVAKAPADLDPSFRTSTYENGTRFYRGMVEHLYARGDGLENELRFSVGKDHWLERAGSQFSYDLSALIMQAREKVRLPLGESLSLDAGVDWQVARTSGFVRSQGFRPQKEGDPPVRLIDEQIMVTEIDGDWLDYPAAFVEAEWSPGAGVVLMPGLRLDWLGAVGQLTVEPRLTVRWAVTPEWVAKAAVGVFHQEPTNDELDEAFGNPALGAERAVHYALGAEYHPLPHVSFDATAFYKDMSNMVGRSDRMIERGGQLVPEQYSNGTRGRVYGADLMFRHDLSRDFFGWVSYTLSRSERRDPGATAWRLFDHDQTHIFTAVASYRLPRNWELGVRWRYTTGSPYTPVEGGVFDSDADSYVPSSGRLNSARLGSFHQLDVRLDKRWVWDGWMLDAYVDLQNAYDRGNPETLSYSYDYTKTQTGTGLPILPVFGLRAEL